MANENVLEEAKKNQEKLMNKLRQTNMAELALLNMYSGIVLVERLGNGETFKNG